MTGAVAGPAIGKVRHEAMDMVREIGRAAQALVAQVAARVGPIAARITGAAMIEDTMRHSPVKAMPADTATIAMTRRPCAGDAAIVCHYPIAAAVMSLTTGTATACMRHPVDISGSALEPITF